jgi:uncharacterized protein (DUF58 family)
MTFPKRGLFKIERARLRTQYPFGLLKKWWGLSADEISSWEIHVLPAPVPMDSWLLEKYRNGREQETPAGRRGEGTTLYHLRAYQYADHPRTIHWKSSAKRAVTQEDNPSWMVREMEHEEKPQVVIQFPLPSEIAGQSDEELELLVQKIYSLWDATKKRGQEARLAFSREEKLIFVSDVMRFLSVWNPKQFLDRHLAPYLSDEDPSERDKRSVTINALQVIHD